MPGGCNNQHTVSNPGHKYRGETGPFRPGVASIILERVTWLWGFISYYLYQTLQLVR